MLGSCYCCRLNTSVFVLEIVLLWVLCTTYNVIARNTTKETEENKILALNYQEKSCLDSLTTELCLVPAMKNLCNSVSSDKM